MENFANDFATTLTAAITTAGQSSITVASSTGAPAANFRIRIDDELMQVTAVAHPTWTVTRGIEGTTAVTHLNGASVAHVLTKGGLDTYAEENFTVHLPSVEAGRTKTIPAGRQWIVAEGLDLEGDIVVLGDLVLI